MVVLLSVLDGSSVVATRKYMEKQAKLIVQPMGGLANRMRVLAKTLSFAKQEGFECLCVWPNNEELGADFQELFSAPNIVLNQNSMPEYVAHTPRKRWKRIIPFLRRFFWMLNKRISVVLAYEDVELWIKKYRDEDGECLPLFQYISSCMKNAQNVVLSTGAWLGKVDYSIFEPTQKLLDEVNQYIDNHKWSSEHTYGLHVRRTDNVWAIEHSPISLFIDKIAQISKADSFANFYLATDDPAICELLTHEFGSRILTRDKDYSRQSIVGIQDAVIDMWLLSKTKKIYGSYYSSFSEAASGIGNVELEIVAK